jgi:hypothetical protein
MMSFFVVYTRIFELNTLHILSAHGHHGRGSVCFGVEQNACTVGLCTCFIKYGNAEWHVQSELHRLESPPSPSRWQERWAREHDTSEEEVVSLNITTNSLTSTEYTIMTSNKAFKAALIVVDLQEDFCPPVSPSPPFSRAQTRAALPRHTKKTSCTETILKPPLSFSETTSCPDLV